MKRISLVLVAACLSLTQAAASAAESGFAVRQVPDQVEITFDGRPVVNYVFRDSKILRPHFANVHVPGGLKVTRNHPPIAGVDAVDHDTMHPGIWLAFGDINGQDFWRNKGRIEHVRFIQVPRVQNGKIDFVSENRLQSTNGQAIGTQISHVAVTAFSKGFLLIWRAEFQPAQQELVFGDQEEMGLGVRIATAITEKTGGGIITSTGAKTAKATWGKSFEWCDYSGELDGLRVGVTLMPDPSNFRPSWFHNRDYGLMVANPFGRKAMNQGENSSVAVKKGDRLRLTFGVYLHSTPPAVETDIPAAYRQFLTVKGAMASD